MSDNNRLNTKTLSEVSILLALAAVLELIAMLFPRQPQGGSISLSMLPVLLIAYRHGLKVGIFSGVAYAILDMIISGFSFVGLHWGVVPLDYLLAYGVLGTSALIFRINRDSVAIFALGMFAAMMGRFFFHFLSGAILFGEYAPEGQPVPIYSILYNGAYMVPSIVLTLLIGVPIFIRLKEQLQS
ncbi:MAG: energy-coupled thiamine transporter ThiT [Candidatus Izemoplasmataceae bacterium]